MFPAGPIKMNRSQFLRSGVSLLAFSSLSTAGFALPSGGDDSLQGAADALVSWARKLLTSYQSWGASIDRGKLADRLVPLNTALLKYDIDKEEFLNLVASKSTDAASLRIRAAFLNDQLKGTLERFQEVLPQIAGHTGGDEQAVFSALNSAVFHKELWVEAYLRDPSTTRAGFLGEGWTALATLQKATGAFADLITALKKG